MSTKKKEIGKKEKGTITIAFVLIIFFCVIWLSVLYFVLKDKWNGWLLTIYSIIVASLISVFATDIRKMIGQCKIWSNPNLKWFNCGILLVDILSVGYLIFIIIPNQGDKPGTIPSPDISVEVGKQRQYDSLVDIYNHRMSVDPTVGETKKTLKEDSLVVSNIVRLLEQTPALDSISKFQYVNAYNDRVDSAMKNIINTVYLPDWTESDFEYMVETYSPILKEIEQMKIHP